MTARAPRNGATRISSILAVLLGCVAVLVALNSHVLGIVLGLLSVLVVAISVLNGGRSWLAAGTLVLIAAIVLAVFEEGPTLSTLTGLALAFVVWDCGEYAIGLGQQVGRAGETARQEIFHGGISIAVAVAGVTVGWTIVTIAPSDIPLVSILPLGIGCLFLLVVLWS